MKVLVIQQKMIGDVLAGTIICRAVKSEFPEAEIHYMVQPNTTPVLDNNPYIEKIIVFDPNKIAGVRGLMVFGLKLKNEKYDSVIDAYGKWESIIPAYFSGAESRIGFYKWYTSAFYTKTIVQRKNIPGSALYHRAQLAEAVTGKFPSLEFPKIFLSDIEISEAKQNISGLKTNGSKIIMISVLGSSSDKSLPADQMAATLDIIATSENIKLLFNYLPEQKEMAQIIFNHCKSSTKEKIIFDFYMKGLRPLLGLLSQCDALVGNEGGAVNMAKALSIPTFTIFSPWINKSSWDMMTDSQRHVAVHLQDYFPELYREVHPKKFKENWELMYKKFTPNLYKTQLREFMDNLIS